MAAVRWQFSTALGVSTTADNNSEITIDPNTPTLFEKNRNVLSVEEDEVQQRERHDDAEQAGD
jgi:hypothetical protein